MPVMQDRRRFLATLSSTASAGLLDARKFLDEYERAHSIGDRTSVSWQRCVDQSSEFSG